MYYANFTRDLNVYEKNVFIMWNFVSYMYYEPFSSDLFVVYIDQASMLMSFQGEWVVKFLVWPHLPQRRCMYILVYFLKNPSHSPLTSTNKYANFSHSFFTFNFLPWDYFCFLSSQIKFDTLNVSPLRNFCAVIYIWTGSYYLLGTQ